MTLQTIHNWKTDRTTPNETHEHCEGHCSATCERSIKTGVLIAFDAQGQNPRPDLSQDPGSTWKGSQAEA